MVYSKNAHVHSNYLFNALIMLSAFDLLGNQSDRMKREPLSLDDVKKKHISCCFYAQVSANLELCVMP